MPRRYLSITRLSVALVALFASFSVTLAQDVRARILEGAKRQLVRPAKYDASYQRLSYPNGDVPLDRGVCTDVVIRALRHAGYDLQRLIHEDQRKAPRSYPRIRRPDRNIDHRRVPNQVAYFRRHGTNLTRRPADWRPGDFVVWILPNGRDHIGVISDRKNARGDWLVIHNIWQTAEEDVLRAYRIVGVYRFPR